MNRASYYFLLSTFSAFCTGILTLKACASPDHAWIGLALEGAGWTMIMVGMGFMRVRDGEKI